MKENLFVIYCRCDIYVILLYGGDTILKCAVSGKLFH